MSASISATRSPSWSTASTPLVAYAKRLDMLENTRGRSLRRRTGRQRAAELKTLFERLAMFFAELLDVTSESPDAKGLPLRVAVSYLYPLNDAERARFYSSGTEPAILTEVPIPLRPVADFLPGRDLSAEDGLCHTLAARLDAWIAENIGEAREGSLRFDLAVYSNLTPLGAEGGPRPLLELADVRLPLAAWT